MKNLNICFIGCGDHANRFVYPSLANCPDITLQAVCALDAVQAEENRKRHGANRAYTDYREMILVFITKPDSSARTARFRFIWRSPAGKIRGRRRNSAARQRKTAFSDRSVS